MDFEKYYSAFTTELNQINDFRLYVLFLHLHIEYWINKIIEKNFGNPDIIFKNKDLRIFSNKLELIKSLGLLHPKSEGLLLRINLINNIRNFYSHNIVGKEDFPPEILDRIRELIKNTPAKEDINTFGIDPVHQFVISSVSIIIALHHNYESVSLPKPKYTP